MTASATAVVTQPDNHCGMQTEMQIEGSYELVIVGAGAAGIAVAASLKSRQSDLEITIIDPAETHYYQPG